MRETLDLTGKTFHWLTVICRIEREWKRWNYWLCKCKCWKEAIRSTSHLNEDVKHSCGCRWWQYHHDSWTLFYKKYREAKKRCNNPNVDSYKYYWGKWVKFEWDSYEDFKRDMYESFIEHCKIYWEKNTSLDRIDYDWNYCKDNCRWATWGEQSLNRCNMKEYKWNKISIAEVARNLWVPYHSIAWKIRRWVPIEWAINNPNQRYFKNKRYINKVKDCDRELAKYI
jgi:hypothetical protein